MNWEIARCNGCGGGHRSIFNMNNTEDKTEDKTNDESDGEDTTTQT